MPPASNSQVSGPGLFQRIFGGPATITGVVNNPQSSPSTPNLGQAYITPEEVGSVGSNVPVVVVSGTFGNTIHSVPGYNAGPLPPGSPIGPGSQGAGGGGGRGSGGGGGGLPPGIVLGSSPIPLAPGETPQARLSSLGLQLAGGSPDSFTGSITQYSRTGLPESTSYDVSGRTIGTLTYDQGQGARAGGTFAKTEGEGGKLKFNRGNYMEDVTFDKQGATIVTQEKPSTTTSVAPEFVFAKPTGTSYSQGRIILTAEEAQKMGLTSGEGGATGQALSSEQTALIENFQQIQKEFNVPVTKTEAFGFADITPTKSNVITEGISSEIFNQIGKVLGGTTIISKYNPASLLTTPFNEKQTRDLTLGDIGNVYATEKFTSIYGIPETRGIIGKGIQTIFPRTYGEAALFVAFPSAYSKLPVLGRATVSGYLAYTGGEGALNKDLSTEERVLAGATGALGAFGLFTESLPYLRGIKSRLSPNYFPVKEQVKGYEAIEIPKVQSPENYALALEKEGKITYEPFAKNLPTNVAGRYTEFEKGEASLIKISSKLPLGEKRTTTIAHELIHYETYKNVPKFITNAESVLPYELQPGEIIAYGLQEKYAQQGFVNKAGFKIGLIPKGYPLKTGETVDVKLPDISPLKRGGFHVKESEKRLFLGGPQTITTSQIGFFQEGKPIVLKRTFYGTPEEPFLKEPETRESRLGLNEGLLNIPKNAEIGFGIPGKAQIGFEEGAIVSRSGKGNTYQLGKGTELEAMKGEETTITNIVKKGDTIIKGQGVEIYSYKTTKGSVPGAKAKAPSTTNSIRVSGESVLSGELRTSELKPTTTTTTFEKSLVASYKTSPNVSTNVSPRVVSFFSPTTRTISPSISQEISPGISTELITKSPSISQPINPNVTIPRTPPITPTVYNPLKTSGYGKRKKPSLRQETEYTLFLKKRGQFKPEATGLTMGGALRLGQERTIRNLARTFKITPTGKTVETLNEDFFPSENIFRTYKVRRGKQVPLVNTFIQKGSANLQTREEKYQLAEAKRLKKLIGY